LSANPLINVYPPYKDIDYESVHIHKDEEVFLLVINNLEGMPGDM
jgi:hypothetical protein